MSRVPAAFFWTDREGNVTDWPFSAQQLLGWTSDDAAGQPPPFIGADSAGVWRNICACVNAGASVRRAELTAITNDGRAIPLRVSSTPGLSIGDDGGEVFHLVWLAIRPAEEPDGVTDPA